jgi:DNA-binding HxlR family transcriptional regulator
LVVASILRDIFFDVTRFDDIQRRLGIARNTLTDRLNWLAWDRR